jgi:integrase
MTDDVVPRPSILTYDNIHLSSLRNGLEGDPKASPLAIQDRLIPPNVRELTQAATSNNTRRAYRSDLAHFLGWGATIPATPETVARYAADYAPLLAVATLARRLVAIGKAHTTQGLESPTGTDLVKHVMRGIRRTYGRPHRQAAAAVTDDIIAMCAGLGDRLKDVRDRALILIGFAGAFRRSELIAIDFTDIEWLSQGVVILLPRSKTDQEGAGRKVAIPFARRPECPVLALKAWLSSAGISEGPVFRPVDRHSRIGSDRLSGDAVATVVKVRACAAGFDPLRYSGHSLRAGLATSAAAAGVSAWKIKAQTGHQSDAMLARYIRDGRLFQDNAAGALL